MMETYHVVFQGNIEVDTCSVEHPYKQIYEALEKKELKHIRIVSADPLNTHREDD